MVYHQSDIPNVGVMVGYLTNFYSVIVDGCAVTTGIA